MPISTYMRRLRRKVGRDLVLMPSVTALVFDGRGRLLVVRHSSGDVWATPGGSIDPDERPADAVVREVWEETGLLVRPVALRGAFGGREFRVRYSNGDAVAYVIIAFECRRIGGRFRPDNDEVLEARWVARRELATLRVARWVPRVLPYVMVPRGRPRIERVTWRPPARRARARRATPAPTPGARVRQVSPAPTSRRRP